MLSRAWSAITVAFRSLTGRSVLDVASVQSIDDMRALKDRDLDTYVEAMKSEVGARYDAGDTEELPQYFQQMHEAAREQDKRRNG